jgi:hypothetical protein
MYSYSLLLPRHALALSSSVRIHYQGPQINCSDPGSTVPFCSIALACSRLGLSTLLSRISGRTVSHGRVGQPVLQILSLTLKAPCSVWYPRTLGSAVSRFDTPCHQLVMLAKSTEVRILFDTKWLGRNLPQLLSVLQGSSQLSGVPILRGTIYTTSFLQADW